MGDFYLDDGFFEHPKALYAGEDAADLYVRGLAWAHRHNTGCIPKGALGRLTSKKNAKALAKKLTDAAPGFDNPLWYDEGEYWRIHDWQIRNAKSIAKREQAKSAAKERWRKHSERNADADADASVSHSDSNADAMPYQPRNQGTKDLSPKPPSHSISPNGSEVADEDPKDKLVIYWLTACLGQQPGRFRLKDLLEAKAALDHLRRYIDARVIEEQIGYLANGKNQPRTANYLLKVCQSWGANNGVTVPPLTLASRQPPADLNTQKEPA